MKQLFPLRRSLLLAFLSLGALASQAQSIGVGTTTPSPNAVLDVYSTSKGLMFPRVDTAAVAKPSAGLMVYSQQLKAPAYYNGNRWNKLAAGVAAGTTPPTAANAPVPTAITYTITDSRGGVTVGTFNSIVTISSPITAAVSFTGGAGASVGRPMFENVVIQKITDVNSIPFLQAMTKGVSLVSIEFLIYYDPSGYVPGSGGTDPVYSIKLLNVYLTGYTVGFGNPTATSTEQITFAAQSFGYKNLALKQPGILYNVSTNIVTTY